MHDTLWFGPLAALRSEFAETNETTLKVRADWTDREYTICLRWNTKEYGAYKAGLDRTKAIEDLRLQLDSLSLQQKSLVSERDKCEEAIARPYEITMVRGAENLMPLQGHTERITYKALASPTKSSLSALNDNSRSAAKEMYGHQVYGDLDAENCKKGDKKISS